MTRTAMTSEQQVNRVRAHQAAPPGLMAYYPDKNIALENTYTNYEQRVGLFRVGGEMMEFADPLLRRIGMQVNAVTSGGDFLSARLGQPVVVDLDYRFWAYAKLFLKTGFDWTQAVPADPGTVIARNHLRAWTERMVYALRGERYTYGWIARACRLTGESTARAYYNRYAAATGTVRVPSERRQRAGRTAATDRWRNTARTRPVRHHPLPGQTQPQPLGVISGDFGVEIEFIGAPQREAARAVAAALGVAHIHVFGYHGSTCLDCSRSVSEPYREWKIEHDGTVTSGRYPHATGGELVSPVLNGEDGFRQIMLVTEALRSVGARVSRRAGLHVHVNVTGFNRGQRANLVQTFANVQSAMFSMVARSRRNNGYCLPLGPQQTADYVNTLRNGRDPSTASRRLALNVAPFVRIGTYEYRLHQGSVNGKKIVSWVRFLLAFTQYAGNASAEQQQEALGFGVDTLIDRLAQTTSDHGFVLTASQGNYLKRRVATVQQRGGA